MIERSKQRIRDRIWALLEREGAAKPPGRVVGKIPNFVGAEAAADQLAALPAWEAAAKEGAAKAGRKVAASELPLVDLVVCGSVAVNRQGARIGKGGGFSDLEVAFLVEAGVIRPDTILATTVHPLQVVDEPLPETIHDFRVDLIVTWDETLWCAEPHRPPGILWEHLQQDKISEVPALAALAAGRRDSEATG